MSYPWVLPLQGYHFHLFLLHTHGVNKQAFSFFRNLSFFVASLSLGDLFRSTAGTVSVLFN